MTRFDSLDLPISNRFERFEADFLNVDFFAIPRPESPDI